MSYRGFVLVLLVLTSGCAAQRQAGNAVVGPPSVAPSRYNASSAETSASGAREAPDPQLRPGLATEWGETRYSRVRRQRFQRASDSPFATASIRYNDATGVAHQAAFRQALQGGDSFVCVYGDGIRISIVDESGSPLPGWVAGDAMYVIGQHGARYSIILTNTTSARFEAVVTVDGLDVMNGQTGSYANRGYLLGSYGTVRIDGFRQSDDHVAAFRFGTVADSYAAQTGSARNVGVIGVALFAELGWAPQPAHTYGDEIRLRETSDPFPNQYAPPPSRRRYY